jgi:hypothetical protein
MHASTLFTAVVLLSAALINAYDPVKMLCLVNEQRARSGLQPLGMSNQLENAAQQHSDDQARMRSMTHNGSDGSSPGDRVERAGYNWRSVAENVAYGYGDEEECMKEWMNSPGHRENILGRDYTHFGSAVGYAGSTPYYTQDFGGDGQKHNFPECPSGGSYGDSGGDSGADNYGDSAPSSDYSGGEDNYGDSAPSNDYGGGSSPSKNYGGGSSPSKNYGGSAPSNDYGGGSSPSKDYGGSSPSKDYGGSAPSGGHRRRHHKHKSGRKPSSYGGDVSDNNDKRSDYGKSSPRKKTTYKAPNKSTKSYGGSKPSHNTRPSSSYGSKISYGNRGGHKGGKQSAY